MNIGEYWNKKHAKYLTQDWIKLPTIFAKQVVKYFPPKGKILELAAGQGQDTRFLASKGYFVTSTDLSEYATEESRKKVSERFKEKVQFKIVDLEKPLEFTSASYDVVYCHLGLHYFSDERTSELFNEIFKVLKPGGIFAALVNTVDDQENGKGRKIEDNFYEIGGIKKRFFTIDYVKVKTEKFEILLLDNKGKTYKDKITTLIRFVGRRPNK